MPGGFLSVGSTGRVEMFAGEDGDSSVSSAWGHWEKAWLKREAFVLTGVA